MPTSSPLVSVLMTCFNREQYVADAINSVLGSTYSNFELIIVDDCSTDSTEEIIKNFEVLDARVKVFINEQNLTDYPNRNKAASFAKGKYIKYVDSDDILYPHGLQVMVNAMEQFPEAGYGLSCLGDSRYPFPKCISPHDAFTEHFNGMNHFDRAPGSAIIKKQAFDIIGGFSGKRMIGDFELWLKLGMYYPLVKFPVDLYWSRQHSGQESQADYSKKYAVLRKVIFEKTFADKDCPLSKTEIKELKKMQQRKVIKSKFLNLIR